MKKVKNIFKYILIFLMCLIVCSIKWAFKVYDTVVFEEALFHLNPKLTESGTGILLNYFFGALIPTILLFIIILLLFRMIFNFLHGYNLILKIKLNGKKFEFKFDENKSIAFFKRLIYLILIIVFVYSIYKIEFFSYMINQTKKSTFIEENYVDPKRVKLEFPQTKRNLIYIFVESYESSYFSIDLGGLKEYNLMSEISELTKNNINFSNTNKFGGAIQIYGLSWTTAGMVAQTAGIPLKIPAGISNETKFNKYLPGAYSIGDILKKEGYNQELLLGSKSGFGNRNIYFKAHGNYKVYDYNTAIKNKKIAKDYYTNWGFEDSILFDIAKEEITKLSKEDEPFNFVTLTTATHFPDGYVEDSCMEKYEDSYSNSIDCSSSQIKEFIEWIKKQDFYDDTTIVISGDHLTMQADFFDDNQFDKRTIYNLFINSAISEENSKVRYFTTMDMYPTTLAAMGVKIDGDRLALGVNLFSGKQTIIEKFGRNMVDQEFSKVSKFYNAKILN